MKRRGRHPIPPAAGFILAATLWALVALTVVAAYIDGVTRTTVEDTQQAKLMLEAELDRRGTEATLLYLLATNRMSHHSLLMEKEQRFSDYDTMLDGAADGALNLAGESYTGLGDTAFSIQDENGLVSVNAPTDPMFTRMVESLGVPARDAARLVPRVVDYIDLDDDLSLDGAEAFSYHRAGKPAPPNWFLATPMELNHVLGVGDLLDNAQWRRLRDLTTPRILVSVNFNTMPAPVAAAVLGVDDEALGPFLAERAETPVTSLARVGELTGQTPPTYHGLVAVLPSYFLRITTWWRGGGPRTVVGVTLTPGSLMGPWRKEYRYSEPADHSVPLQEPQTELLGGRSVPRT